MEVEERNIIQDLLGKFQKDEMVHAEINELNELINNELEHNSLEKYYTEIWDLSSKRHSDIHSEELFNKIKNSISISEQTETKVISLKSKSIGFALRYAAVFIIAFLSAWFGRIIFVEENTIQKYNDENIVEVLYGSKSQIQLPDGSVVNLNSGSRITYPTSFKDGHRDVYLSGEAFFQVEADVESPFYVHTSDLTVKVTGTEFNIKSYPDSKSIETTLVKGKLQILDKKKKNKTIAVLSPNETAVFKKANFKDEDEEETKDIPLNFKEHKPIYVKNEINTSDTYAWKNNLLVFNNQNFYDLAVRLERWYDVEINIQDKEIANERFTGKFDKETIEQALNALQLIVPFEYEIKKNNITIRNK